MTEPTELLPCPFCGGINIIHCGHHMYCHACGADGPDADSQHETEAIAAWNRRAPTAQPAVDALAEAEYFIDNPSAWSNFDQRASDAIAAVCKAFRAAHAPADSVTAPAAGNWIAADDVNRLVRELDVCLNGETGAAAQASLCDVVAQVRHEAAKRGQPLLAAPAAGAVAGPSEPTPAMYQAAQMILLPTGDDDGGSIMLNTSQVRALWQAMLAVAHTPPTQAADSVLEDAARLDWLDEDDGNHVTRVGKTWYTRPAYGRPYRKHKNLRAAIDAARAAQKGGA